MDAYSVLIQNSSLGIGNDTWEHLNAQTGGAGTVIMYGDLEVEVNCDDFILELISDTFDIEVVSNELVIEIEVPDYIVEICNG